MKNVRRKLPSEMMADFRWSDRELAKQLQISQPTVTRTRRWLETKVFITQCMLMPNFTKIGFELARAC